MGKQMIFLPATVTSLLQPVDQDVIVILKENTGIDFFSHLQKLRMNGEKC